MAPQVELNGFAGGVSTASAEILSAASASLIYTASARRFAQKAQQLDNVTAYRAGDATQQSEIETDLLSTSLACVTAAYFGVESLLNETFLAHALGLHTSFSGLDRNTAARLSDAWEAGAFRLNPREKASIALVIAGATPLDWGSKHCQAFALLHDLRNELVHHKPKWTRPGTPGSESGDKLGLRLHQAFGEAEIWAGRGAAYRWSGCLGGSCAAWAYRAGVQFCREFSSRLGVRHPWLED